MSIGVIYIMIFTANLIIVICRGDHWSPVSVYRNFRLITNNFPYRKQILNLTPIRQQNFITKSKEIFVYSVGATIGRPLGLP